MGRISLGPRLQLMPRASAPRPRAVAAKLPTVQPVKVRPPASKLMLDSTGKAQVSLQASRAAFSSYRSVKVSQRIRSAPASAPARTIWAKAATASSKGRVPAGSSSSPSGPMSKATRLPQGSAARRAQPMPAATTWATVYPLPASLWADAPKVLAQRMRLPAAAYRA